MADEPVRYTPFIRGETIDLCVPSESAIAEGWADWFNDEATTRWLGHGVFPHHPEDQRSFLEGVRRRERFVVLICGKGGQPLYGTISLAAIDWVARSAQIALVLGRPPRRGELIGLEAMARVTDHAFRTMGLDRLYAGQVHPGLSRWTRRLELLGYFTEGIQRRGFVKGRAAVQDVAMLSCLYDDYAAIAARRGGSAWPGNDAMRRLNAALPPTGFAGKLGAFLERELPAHKTALADYERRALAEAESPGTEPAQP
jgi:RimJ/RimL family protein N-acetyltransferase